MSVDPDFNFPDDPLDPRFEEIVAVGGVLSPELLLQSYRRGIFPWPHDGYPMLWFFPGRRGILTKSSFHVPTSLKKFSKKKNWTYTIDQAFESVILNCQTQVRPGQEGTWINENVLDAFSRFHHLGHAHSLEVWDDEKLIGGIYGVFVEGLFSAESMFYKESNASKLALWKLCEFLFSYGLDFIDIQMVTSVCESMGGHYVSKKQFWKMLQRQKKSHQLLLTEPCLKQAFLIWNV